MTLLLLRMETDTDKLLIIYNLYFHSLSITLMLFKIISRKNLVEDHLAEAGG